MVQLLHQRMVVPILEGQVIEEIMEMLAPVATVKVELASCLPVLHMEIPGHKTLPSPKRGRTSRNLVS